MWGLLSRLFSFWVLRNSCFERLPAFIFRQWWEMYFSMAFTNWGQSMTGVFSHLSFYAWANPSLTNRNSVDFKMQQLSVLAASMKTIILMRVPGLNWELFMRPRVSLPSCRSCAIAPENATCQLGASKLLPATVVQHCPSMALGWGAGLQLGKAGKITFSVFWAYGILKFAPSNMVTGGNSGWVLSWWFM